MSQPMQFQMMICDNPSQYNDTTFTKIFVGGLAWETQRDNLRRYFEQFGEILEAVVISDKYTGRSKGYGFVTFKDPEAAMRACQNPSPVIDGRRANCNLASLGAQEHRQSTPQNGPIRFRATPGLVVQSVHQASSSTFFHQPTGQYTFPYSTYGYTEYSQDSIYAMNYYGSPQFSTYLSASAGTSGVAGMFQNLYPMYAQYAQRSQAYAFGVQYPPIVQYPYLPQRYGSSTGILSLPSSLAMAITTGGTPTTVVTSTSTVSSQASGTDSEQNSSST